MKERLAGWIPTKSLSRVLERLTSDSAAQESEACCADHGAVFGSDSRSPRSPDPRAVPGEAQAETGQHHSRFVVQWHITERCNLRCAHCYQDDSPTPELPLPQLLEILQQLRELIDDLEVHRGAAVRAQVNVTGGEPFIRPDFMDLLNALAAEKPRFAFGVLTNGSLVDDKVAERLSELGPRIVQVSLEGEQPTHDRIRGTGDFDRTVGAVRRLIRHGVPTMISFTAHRLNFREFRGVAKVGQELGVKRVWGDRLIPLGRGSKFQTLTPLETREFFQIMRQARDETERAGFYRTEIPMHRALQFLEGGRFYHCSAGGNLLTLLPNGDVLPCRRMPIRVGNAFEQPLANLYFENRTLQALRDGQRVSEGCEECRFESQCRGGLRCLAHAMTGTPFQADPGCWLSRPCFDSGARSETAAICEAGPGSNFLAEDG